MSTPTEDAARQAAQQLAALLRAIVELARVLESARSRQPQQPANNTPARQQPAERYAAAIERTFGPQVRQTLTRSPEWQRVVDQLAYLERAGIGAEQLLGTLATLTHPAVPQQAPTPTPPAPQPQAPAPEESTATKDRQTALAEAGLSSQDNERMVRIALEAAPPGIGELLVASDKTWPWIAQRMYALEQRNIDPAAHLGRIQQEMTAQAAVGQRPDAAAAALAALSKPAPAPATASTRRAPAAEPARTGPDPNLRRAAALAVQNHGVSTPMLPAEGFNTRETGRLPTELENHKVVGPLRDSGMHPSLVSSADEAHARLAGRDSRARTAAAASATSPTAAPPRAGGPAPAAAATSAEAPAHAAGRRR